MAEQIEKQIEYHREWLRVHGENIYVSNKQFLLNDINAGILNNYRLISAHLDGLATYYGILGLIKIIDGNKQGWNDISTSVDFHGWSQMIRSDMFFRNREHEVLNLTIHISRIACLVCVSDKWQKMAESVLRRANSDPKAIDESFWKPRRFEPFVLHCCNIRDSISSNTKLKQPYADVFKHWNNAELLSESFTKICDYHCENIDDSSEERRQEFIDMPFDLLPCELMLVNRVRKQLGLSQIKVSHPLVDLLGVGENVDLDQEEHPLLKMVSDAYASMY